MRGWSRRSRNRYRGPARPIWPWRDRSGHRKPAKARYPWFADDRPSAGRPARSSMRSGRYSDRGLQAVPLLVRRAAGFAPLHRCGLRGGLGRAVAAYVAPGIGRLLVGKAGWASMVGALDVVFGLDLLRALLLVGLPVGRNVFGLRVSRPDQERDQSSGGEAAHGYAPGILPEKANSLTW